MALPTDERRAVCVSRSRNWIEPNLRREFVQALVELGERDRRVVLLTGDLGYMALEPFVERFPDRFFNVGVAEQNMLGLATGLAEAGYRAVRLLDRDIREHAAVRVPTRRRDPALSPRAAGRHRRRSRLRPQRRFALRARRRGADARATRLDGHDSFACAACRLRRSQHRRGSIVRSTFVSRGSTASSRLSSSPFGLGGASLVGDGEDLAIVAIGSPCRGGAHRP